VKRINDKNQIIAITKTSQIGEKITTAGITQRQARRKGNTSKGYRNY